MTTIVLSQSVSEMIDAAAKILTDGSIRNSGDVITRQLIRQEVGAMIKNPTLKSVIFHAESINWLIENQ